MRCKCGGNNSALTCWQTKCALPIREMLHYLNEKSQRGLERGGEGLTGFLQPAGPRGCSRCRNGPSLLPDLILPLFFIILYFYLLRSLLPLFPFMLISEPPLPFPFYAKNFFNLYPCALLSLSLQSWHYITHCIAGHPNSRKRLMLAIFRLLSTHLKGEWGYLKKDAPAAERCSESNTRSCEPPTRRPMAS